MSKSNSSSHNNNNYNISNNSTLPPMPLLGGNYHLILKMYMLVQVQSDKEVQCISPPHAEGELCHVSTEIYE